MLERLVETFCAVVGEVLRRYFPKMPCYECFVTLQPSVLIPLLGFLLSRRGQRTGIYYINSTARQESPSGFLSMVRCTV